TDDGPCGLSPSGDLLQGSERSDADGRASGPGVRAAPYGLTRKMRRVRLCLSIEIQEGMSYAQTLAMTRAGERLGYEAALLAEHYYPSGLAERYPGGPGNVLAADAWIYLAGMARETHTIRLGTLVTPVTFRHPSVVAKMAATLDHLSDGRAEL